MLERIVPWLAIALVLLVPLALSTVRIERQLGDCYFCGRPVP